MVVVTVTVLMDQSADHPYHRATLAALGHAASQLSTPVDVRVVRTDEIGSAHDLVSTSAAIVIGPGSPYADPNAAIDCIRSARESGVPLVGT